MCPNISNQRLIKLIYKIIKKGVDRVGFIVQLLIMNNYKALIKALTIRTLEIEKDLRKDYNRRDFMAKYGSATIKDVASMIARREA